MKIYISGKIGTLELTNAIRAKFNAVQAFIEREGHEAINPIDPKHIADGHAYSVLTDPYTRLLLYDLCLVAKADAILLLPDYVSSPGARAEYAFAQAIGKKCLMLEEEVFKGILRQSGVRDPIDDVIDNLLSRRDSMNPFERQTVDWIFRYTINELHKNSLRDLCSGIHDGETFDPWKFSKEFCSLPMPPEPKPFRPIHHLHVADGCFVSPHRPLSLIPDDSDNSSTRLSNSNTPDANEVNQS